jgi:hypothetical protein
MTRPNLKTELQNDWNQIISNLTQEEKQAVAKLTPADWFSAFIQLVFDVKYWQGVGTAFLSGISKGVENSNFNK